MNYGNTVCILYCPYTERLELKLRFHILALYMFATKRYENYEIEINRN